MTNSFAKIVDLDYQKAVERLKPVVIKTPLVLSRSLSRKYSCNVYLKREDLQVVRSYKLRGAYNMMSSLSREQLDKVWFVQAQAIMHRDLHTAVKNWV